MSIQWNKQVALLTGATGGIGQAIALALAKRGATLILTGRNRQKLNELSATLPGQHHVVVADLANNDGLAALATQATQLGVTMLINNAGVTDVGAFEHLAPATLNHIMQTNLLSPMLLTKQLLPQLKQAAPGYLINIGSAFGSIGFAAHGAYCASKFGLRGWTESLLRELHGQPVNVFYFAPRATQTAINSGNVVAMNDALGNAMDPPERVASELIRQLESGKRRWVVGYPEKIFARLNGVLPGLVDNALFKKLPVIQQFTANKESML